jgi:hypothetical protein
MQVTHSIYLPVIGKSILPLRQQQCNSWVKNDGHFVLTLRLHPPPQGLRRDKMMHMERLKKGKIL